MTNSKTPCVDDLRAQRDELDRQVARATVDPMEAFVALLGSAEITDQLDRLTAAAVPLDEVTRKRVEQWARTREALAKLADIELARLRKLVS